MSAAPNPALVLVTTVVLWLPSARNLLAGDLGLAAAAVRFGLALAVAWAANEIVRRVFVAYARHNKRRHRQAQNTSRPAPTPPVSRLSPLLDPTKATASTPASPPGAGPPRS